MEVFCLVAAAGGSCSAGQQPAAQALAAAVQLSVVAQDGTALPEVRPPHAKHASQHGYFQADRVSSNPFLSH